MKIKILIPGEVEIDDANIQRYINEINSRMSTNDDFAYPTDIISQALIDGDITELADDWRVDPDDDNEIYPE